VAPKSTDPSRLAQDIDVFDFALSAADVVALDALGRADAKMPDADVFGH